jgi:hypothetical protein
MTRKVKVALIDKDLKVEFKNFPLTSDGAKIDITQGGKAHFKPEIGTTNYLDIPTKKKYLFFGERSYRRTYFTMKWAKKVIDFKTPNVPGIDIDAVMAASGNKILESKGKQKTEMSTLQIITAIIVFLSLLLQLRG